MGVRSSANLPIDGFTIPATFVQTNSTISPVTIYPRYNTSTADSFVFDSADDYAPAAATGGGTNAYYDFAFPMYTGLSPWYNDVYDNYAGRRNGGSNAISDVQRVSLWVNMDVGTSPHPSPYDDSSTRLAILMNAVGANHWYQTTASPTPNYSEPRCFCNNVTAFQNFRVTGQNYSNGAYNSWRCLAHFQNLGSSSTTTLRIINIGGKEDNKSLIVIRAMVLLMHGRTGVSGD